MKIKSFMTMLLILATACCFSACSDNEDGNKTNEQTNQGHKLTPADIADFAASNFIWHVCDVEVDTATMQWKSWTLNYGQVLHPETPYMRYAQTNSREEARQKFLDMICSEATVDSSSVTGIITVDMGSHGTVKYTPVDKMGEWAHVDVNLKELPDLQTIVFCNQEAWPLNSNNCGVKRNQVFKGIKKGHEVFYICIKECGGDHYGFLIGFDTWTIEGTGPSDHKYDGRKCYDVSWTPCIGDIEIMKYLHGFLYNGDKTRNKDAENIIKEISKRQGGHPNNKKLCGDLPLYNFLYSEGKLNGRWPFFKAGNEAPGISDCKGGTGEPYHFIRTPYTVIKPDSYRWSKICYNCSDVDPQGSFKSSWDMWTACNTDHWPVIQFKEQWIWKAGEWYSFQEPYVIKFWDTDAPNLKEFKKKYTLEDPNIDD
ncbi:MAG: hypothetical protein K6F02_05605 [Prevotella sp.]|nr:hypothetical protein [Prevotella sp.]